MPEPRKHRHNPEILKGMARGVWADLWATEQEEKGRSFSGQDITEAAPRTPPWAAKWAKGVADDIVKMNGKSLEELYELVKENGYPHDEDQFGLHLGMQATGAGISWSDDVSHTRLHHDAIKLPYKEFYR